MTLYARRFASNMAGVAWTAVMQAAFTPLFLRAVGVEGYGFIGFFVTLQAVLQIFDFGFGPTINRRLARVSGGAEGPAETRNLARTLEVMSFALAGLAGAVLAVAAMRFGRWWLRPAASSPLPVERSLLLMAFTITAQWPVTFYQSGLLGLGRAGRMNAAKIVATTLSAAGAAFVLTKVSPTVPASVQGIVAVLHVVTLRVLFWRALPPSPEHGRFRSESLRSARRFAAGMTGITLFGVMTTQVDRLILSRIVPLDEFGCYTLAWVVASGLALVIVPAHNTLFPQLSARFGDEDERRRSFHDGAQLLSALLLPLASVVALFAEPLLFAWSGNAAIAARTAPLAMLLVIGMTFNGLMHPPYALQLASGSTRLPFQLAVGQFLFMAPAVLLLAPWRGAVGAACAWPAMNALYLGAGSMLTLRRWLPGAQGKWLLEDVGRPLLAAIVPAVLARMWIPLPPSRIGSAAVIAAIFALSLVASVLASPAAARMLRSIIRPSFR